MLGAPGSGKGTRATVLAEILKVPQVSTGDIFRANIKAMSPLGSKVKSYMDKGELVPDSIVVEMVKSRLEEADCLNGFILDGFPRTLPQAEALDIMLSGLKKSLTCVVNLEVPDEEIVRRISGRLVCSGCPASYHKEMSPPKVAGICDKCGKPLYVREDDKIETILKRLAVFKKTTYPLIEYYEKKGLLVRVSANTPISTLKGDMTEIVRKLGFSS